MDVSIDTNVILDAFEHREPFYADAEEIILKAAAGDFTALVNASSVTDIYYLLSRSYHSRELAKQAVEKLLVIVKVIGVSGEDCENALHLDMPDYEDALLAQCAARVNAECIVTRNTADFENSPVSAITPEDFLKRCGL